MDGYTTEELNVVADDTGLSGSGYGPTVSIADAGTAAEVRYSVKEALVALLENGTQPFLLTRVVTNAAATVTSFAELTVHRTLLLFFHFSQADSRDAQTHTILRMSAP